MADSAAAVNNTIEQGPATIGSSKADSTNYSAMQWLVAWVVLITVLVFLARTRLGYLLIYYALAISVVILLVTQYKWFASALAPFQSLKPGVVAGSAAEEPAPTHSETQ